MPAGLRPELARPIPTRVDELDELSVGDVVHVNLEGAHFDTMLRELVVPSERNRGAIRSERCDTGGNRDGRARRRLAAEFVPQPGSRGAFLSVRQAMPHVEQRFLVHRLVLEGGKNCLAATHRAVLTPGEIELRTAERVDDRLVGAAAERQDFIAGRPDRGGSASRHRLIDTVGIDAPLEQTLHLRVDARQAEPTVQQRNHAERRQVPFIENDGIPECDWTSVVRVGIQQVEQPARPLAVALIPVDETLAIDRNGGDSGRQGFPFQRARAFMSFDAGTGLSVSGRGNRRGGSVADHPHEQPTLTWRRKTRPTEKSQPDRCRAGLSMLGSLAVNYCIEQVAETIFTLLTFSDGALAGRAAGSVAALSLSALSPMVPMTSTVCPT